MSGAFATPARRQNDAQLGRDLALFFAFRFLATSYLFLPVLVQFYRSRGLNYTSIALLNTVYVLTAIVFEVPTGALADRFGRCRAMMLGALLMALGCMVNYVGHSFWIFAIGEGLLALGMTLASGADSAYLYDLLRSFGQEHRYRLIEGRATSAKLAGAAIALLAGGILGHYAVEQTYIITALVCGVAALIAFGLREPAFARRSERRFITSMFETGRRVFRFSPLRTAVVLSILCFTLLRMGLYLHPSYLEAIGLPMVSVGGVMAGLSLVAAVAATSIDALRKRVSEHQLAFGLLFLLALSALGTGLLPAFYGLPLLVVHGIANGIYSPFSKELINREIFDSGERATALSIESMGRRLAFGAFAPICGFLMDSRGIGAGFIATGVGGIVALGVFAVEVRRMLARHPGMFQKKAISAAGVLDSGEGYTQIQAAQSNPRQ